MFKRHRQGINPEQPINNMSNTTQWTEVRNDEDMGDEITSTRRPDESLFEAASGSFRLVRHRYQEKHGNGWKMIPASRTARMGHREVQNGFDQGTIRGVAFYRDITPEQAMREAASAWGNDTICALLNGALDRAGVSKLRFDN
jgi:hypothetical protein